MPFPEDISSGTPRNTARTSEKWARYALVATTLYGIWIVLSGKFQAQYLVIGAIGSLIVAAGVFPVNAARPFPVLRFIAFIPWHLWQVLISNLRVAKTALAPLSAIAPQFVRVTPGLKDERALTVLGCAITLTPGTLTLDISPESLYVHALDADSADDIRKGTMAHKVAGVFAP